MLSHVFSFPLTGEVVAVTAAAWCQDLAKEVVVVVVDWIYRRSLV